MVAMLWYWVRREETRKVMVGAVDTGDGALHHIASGELNQ